MPNTKDDHDEDSFCSDFTLTIDLDEFRRPKRINVDAQPHEINELNSAVANAIHSLGATSAPHHPDPKAKPSSTAPKLSTIFKDFKAFKRGSKEILDASLDEYETALDDLIFVCGDVPVDEITFDHACEFREICQKLPKHRNKTESFKGKSCTELLALNTSEFTNISARTVSDRLGYSHARNSPPPSYA